MLMKLKKKVNEEIRTHILCEVPYHRALEDSYYNSTN